MGVGRVVAGATHALGRAQRARARVALLLPCSWVAPGVCQRYGIAPSAAEAWEAGGGGAYSRKPDMAAVPAHLRAKGWSDAKAFAATQMLKNPNRCARGWRVMADAQHAAPASGCACRRDC